MLVTYIYYASSIKRDLIEKQTKTKSVWFGMFNLICSFGCSPFSRCST